MPSKVGIHDRMFGYLRGNAQWKVGFLAEERHQTQQRVVQLYTSATLWALPLCSRTRVPSAFVHKLPRGPRVILSMGAWGGLIFRSAIQIH
ncbi:hypothetical protein PILCRDRAFT_811177 [Piloderma croceum F 1598]|uniref:Uncharacterized protein n=1 Tax=Piloderma croceum (strain F 1598) TaxID=765440 RepID=A0A0C3BW03_PILCF|nr:hypothetical protein PILCRDRAFT_811177 [Piloderma croceum F 1598]